MFLWERLEYFFEVLLELVEIEDSLFEKGGKHSQFF